MLTMVGFQPDTSVPARVWPSPNFDIRAHGCGPDILLLHYTGMPSMIAARDRLSDPDAKVSSHYLIDEDGTVFQLVAEKHRAWHAGLSFWERGNDINSRSIGIEIVNPGHEFGYRPFPPQQIAALIAVADDIVARHEILPDHVLGHSDVAPMRKEDPGELFPWDQLAQAGIGLWAEPAAIVAGAVLQEGDEGEQTRALQEALASYGYGVAPTGNFDAATAAVVRAFQRHFRPARVDGRADPSTRETLRRLLCAHAELRAASA